MHDMWRESENGTCRPKKKTGGIKPWIYTKICLGTFMFNFIIIYIYIYGHPPHDPIVCFIHQKALEKTVFLLHTLLQKCDPKILKKVIDKTYRKQKTKKPKNQKTKKPFTSCSIDICTVFFQADWWWWAYGYGERWAGAPWIKSFHLKLHAFILSAGLQVWSVLIVLVASRLSAELSPVCFINTASGSMTTACLRHRLAYMVSGYRADCRQPSHHRRHSSPQTRMMSCFLGHLLVHHQWLRQRRFSGLKQAFNANWVCMVVCSIQCPSTY